MNRKQIQICGADVHPTEVFFAYWYFAAERQLVFFNRLRSPDDSPTQDEILLRYKFTNAYRASDRVSQYLIRSVIYRDDLPAEIDEVFFRVLLFKLFNKIETWEGLEKTLGPITWDSYNFGAYDRYLTECMSRKERIYSAAYIIPSAGKAFGYKAKHQNHLRLIEWMMKNEFPKRIHESESMAACYELLASSPSLGPFLAYQFATDINYSELTDFAEDQFVVAGPGARDGIEKSFDYIEGVSAEDVIRFMYENQETYLAELNSPFLSLWGRPLQLIDCQNLFCEISKYARVAYPQITSSSGRTRIKQSFAAGRQMPAPWYPPKWELNSKIAKDKSILGISSEEAVLPNQQIPLFGS